VRYRNVVFDNARWDGFPFRADDIVISTPPKSGTTWMQMLCAMSIFDAVSFDRPLADISPWVDMQTNSRDDVVVSLQEQQHRRFMKTHTPLDGVPVAQGVTYICVGRDPRDVALSFQHHWENLDLAAFMGARAIAVGTDDLAELGPLPTLPEDPLERFWLWVDAEPGQYVGPALVDVLHHVQTFWDRRHDPRVELFHYSDLLADLPGEFRRLGDVLSIEIGDQRVYELTAAASFDRMRQRADELVPDVRNRIWQSNRDFFHKGTDGQWRELLDDSGLRRYRRRVDALVAPDVSAWAHGGWLAAVA
jgi:aryl sulfotransferase